MDLCTYGGYSAQCSEGLVVGCEQGRHNAISDPYVVPTMQLRQNAKGTIPAAPN